MPRLPPLPPHAAAASTSATAGANGIATAIEGAANGNATTALESAAQEAQDYQWTPKLDSLLLRAITRRIDLTEHGAKVWTRLREDFKAYKISGNEPTFEQTMQRCYRLRWSETLYDATWNTFPGALRWNRPFGNDNTYSPSVDAFGEGSCFLGGESDEDSEDDLTMVEVKRKRGEKSDEEDSEDGAEDGEGNNANAGVVAGGGPAAAAGQAQGGTGGTQGQANGIQHPEPQHHQATMQQQDPTINAAAPRTNKREADYLVEAENKRIRIGAPPPKGTRLVSFPNGEFHLEFGPFA